MITNAMVKTFDHNHDYHPHNHYYHPHNHDYQPHNHDYHPYNYDYHPGPPTAWRELGNGGRAPHRVLRVANLFCFYHFIIIIEGRQPFVVILSS